MLQLVPEYAAAPPSMDMAIPGALLAASHVSLRDDFETSHPEVDRLVAQIQHILGGDGSARMTGAGYWRTIVAVTSVDRVGKLGQLDRAIISA